MAGKRPGYQPTQSGPTGLPPNQGSGAKLPGSKSSKAPAPMETADEEAEFDAQREDRLGAIERFLENQLALKGLPRVLAEIAYGASAMAAETDGVKYQQPKRGDRK